MAASCVGGGGGWLGGRRACTWLVASGCRWHACRQRGRGALAVPSAPTAKRSAIDAFTQGFAGRARGATLPEQVVGLRLQGQWRDWLDFEQAHDAQAPWWVVDQWQVVPAGQVVGEVRIELQTRLGLRPPALGQPQAQRRWPAWPTFAGGLQPAGQVLFAGTQTPVASKPATAAVMPTDLRSRSAQDLRLLGIWHRADAAYAVFGDGLDHITVTLGQRVGRDGYRVRRIAPDRVVLGSADARAPVLDIRLQGDKP